MTFVVLAFFKFDPSYFNYNHNEATNERLENGQATMIETFLSPRQHVSSSIIRCVALGYNEVSNMLKSLFFIYRYTPELQSRPEWLESIICAEEMSVDG